MALRFYIFPVLKALLLHALVIGVFFFNWERDADSEVHSAPRIVQAKVLTMADPIAARKEAERKKEAARKKATAKQKREARKKAEAKKKTAAKNNIAAIKKADAKKTAEAKKKADKKRQAAEQLRAEKQRADKKRQDKAAAKERQQALAREQERREQQRLLVLADKLAKQQAEAEAVAVQSYKSLIQQRVKESWHIPLSARDGMTAVLRVNLLPTGEVVNVAIVKGSGDDAFDRSVVQAVQRVEKIEELQQLETRVFDANFRQFNFLFKPLDLD
jgi:colicin import membrane protein